MTHIGRGTWWRELVVAGVVAGSLVVCVGPALLGHQHWNVGGLSGFLGGLWGVRMQHADYWALSRPERLRVLAASRGGVPTGEPRLDEVVAARLDRAARSARTDRVARPVVAAVMFVVPVLATVRTGNGWYLLCLVPVALVAVRYVGLARREDPRVRLARFHALASG